MGRVQILPLFSLAAAMLAQSPIESRAQQILSENCVVCHGQTRMSDLDLRQIETIRKGGKRGPAVIPGKSAESLLYRALAQTGDLKMPPGKAPLSAVDVETIRRWIDAGAHWPEAIAVRSKEPSWWAFRKPQRPEVPPVKDSAWVRTPVDAFVLHKLEAQGLRPAPPIGKTALIRRVYFDVIGLPPSPDEVRRFVEDPSRDAYEKLVERLLASPQYGERWGRHWLDVVRYADSTGFESDLYYRNAWRYRDYVIRSFNQNKPYDEFVQEQIAADEIWPDDNELQGIYLLSKEKAVNLERRIGTGMYTVGPMDPSSALDGAQLRYDRLTDAADTTSAAFLGLSLGCARCHDHKFDPVSQKDYYRLQAIFAASEPRDIPAVDAVKVFTYWKSINKQLDVEHLKSEIRRLDDQVRARAGRRKDLAAAYTPEEQSARDKLLRKLAEEYVELPDPYPTATVLAHRDIVPETRVAVRGDFRSPGDRVEPGFPAALYAGEIPADPSQRRKALALWLTSPDHPLTARVMVNRIWQWHFGRGIVATPNDFGRQGEAPTHPELLDWLATEFVARGWNIKAMHRLILLSNTYGMSVGYDEQNAKIDAENRYLWRMNRTRLDAEAVRDAVLACAGTLNSKAGGPPVIPPLAPDEVNALGDVTQWPATLDPKESFRRSIYMYAKRTFRLPMLETFDAPDSSLSCSRRDITNVAPQALALLNNEFVLARASEFANRLRKLGGDDPEAWVTHGFEIALGRGPSAAERAKALGMLEPSDKDHALADFCLMLFNLNEFVYVD
jgi:hypothetical protein